MIIKKTEKVYKIFKQAVFSILNVVLVLLKPFIEYNKSNTMLIRRVLWVELPYIFDHCSFIKAYIYK